MAHPYRSHVSAYIDAQRAEFEERRVMMGGIFLIALTILGILLPLGFFILTRYFPAAYTLFVVYSIIVCPSTIPFVINGIRLRYIHLIKPQNLSQTIDRA